MPSDSLKETYYPTRKKIFQGIGSVLAGVIGILMVCVVISWLTIPSSIDLPIITHAMAEPQKICGSAGCHSIQRLQTAANEATTLKAFQDQGWQCVALPEQPIQPTPLWECNSEASHYRGVHVTIHQQQDRTQGVILTLYKIE